MWTFEPLDEYRPDPLVTAAQVTGTYPAEVAAAAAQASMTDQGSGQWRTDD